MKNMYQKLKGPAVGFAAASLLWLGLKYLDKPDYTLEIKKVRHNTYWCLVNNEQLKAVSDPDKENESFNSLCGWLSDGNDPLGELKKSMQGASGIDSNDSISILEIRVTK